MASNYSNGNVKNPDRMRTRFSLFYAVQRLANQSRSSFRRDADFDYGGHITFEFNDHFVFANQTQCAFWQSDFTLLDWNTCFVDCISNITCTDRTKQYAFI